MDETKRGFNKRVGGGQGHAIGKPTAEDDLALIVLVIRAETMRLRKLGSLKRVNRAAANRLRRQAEALARDHLPERLRPCLLMDLEEALVRRDLTISPSLASQRRCTSSNAGQDETPHGLPGRRRSH